MRVRKAVFPAAGWGTRFLPATKAQPKEMLPLVDKPIIQYGVEEAVAAGIEQIIIVTSRTRVRSRTTSTSTTSSRRSSRRRARSRSSARSGAITDLAQLAYVRQKEQLGLGHAILMAKDLIGHEPFAVLLPDDVVVADRPCIGQLIHAYEQTHSIRRRGQRGPGRRGLPLRHRRRRGRRELQGRRAAPADDPDRREALAGRRARPRWPSSGATS